MWCLAAMAAKQVNRPVKLVLRATQMFGPVGFRRPPRQTIALAAKRRRRADRARHDTLDHTSSFDEFVEPRRFPARMLYSSPNDATSHRLVRLDIGTPSFMRAPGEAPGSYALEAAMDELAYELKMDPLDLRLKNYADQDPEKNKPWSSKSLRECYRKGAEQFGWSRATTSRAPCGKATTLIGWGWLRLFIPLIAAPPHARAKLVQTGRFS